MFRCYINPIFLGGAYFLLSKRILNIANGLNKNPDKKYVKDNIKGNEANDEATNAILIKDISNNTNNLNEIGIKSNDLHNKVNTKINEHSQLVTQMETLQNTIDDFSGFKNSMVFKDAHRAYQNKFK